MVGFPYDLLTNPLGAVRLTFENAIRSGADPRSLAGKDWGVVDLFHNFLFDLGHVDEVPFLSSAAIAAAKKDHPWPLYRFRCMIQDMLHDEMYIAASLHGENWRTHKYMDYLEYEMNPISENCFSNRCMLYCVPVPGLNSWAEPIYAKARQRQISTAFQGQDKDQKMIDDCNSHSSFPLPFIHSEDLPKAKKMRDDSYASTSGKFEGSNAHEAGPVTQGADCDSAHCLVKIYDTPECDMKLNGIYEFIGILIPGCESYMSEEMIDELLISPSGLSSAKIPCLHCIIYKRLDIHNFLYSCPVIKPELHLIKDVKVSLLRHLTLELGNDEVVAHFVLLHLISSVQARVNNLAVGKFSLKLLLPGNGNTSSFVAQLVTTLKNLLPFTGCITLSPGYLNATRLVPSHDVDKERLNAGVLQLADGSHLVVDESRLQTESLTRFGTENVKSLCHVIENQKMEYIYPYYNIEMETDIQILTLSDSCSSALPADVTVPFQPSPMPSSEVASIEALEAWRWYLCCVRSLPRSIGADIQEAVENDLVAARQADRGIGYHDFNRLVTMGCLMAASLGESSLSLEHWQMTKELEQQRVLRCK